jgi:hypothetical protein
MFEITKDGKVFLDGVERTQSTHTAGYKIVSKNKKLFYVHRLVAQTYIPNPHNYRTVNHKNGVKDDNRVENLEWATRRSNCEHARLNKLSELKSQGIKDLTYEQYLEMVELRKNGMSFRKIGILMGLEYRRVNDTLSGKRYKDYKERMEVTLV